MGKNRLGDQLKTHLRDKVKHKNGWYYQGVKIRDGLSP
jgi:hypothetical protein